MKINFSTVMNDLRNQPLKDAENKDLTLGMVCSSALLNTYPDEKTVSGDEKVRRFKLAEKVYAAGEQSVAVEEVALLKSMIAKAFPPIIVGRAYAALDTDA